MRRVNGTVRSLHPVSSFRRASHLAVGPG